MSNVKCVSLIAAAVMFLGAAPAPQLHLPRPQIFAPVVVSGPADGGSPTFSPDGKTLLFTRSSASGTGTIFESHFIGRAWSSPAVASFSGAWNDQHPSYAPDGSYIVFVSTRPAPGSSTRVAHIWKVQRTAHGWGVPQHLPAAVNFGRWMFAPSVASDGTIYYLSITRSGKQRLFQLCRARIFSGVYQTAQTLSFSSPRTADVDPEIAPDQSFLIFASSGRRAGDSNEHLYVVKRDGARWGKPEALRYDGDDQNGGSNDNEPRIGPGDTLYFASDRTGNTNVWMVRLPQI